MWSEGETRLLLTTPNLGPEIIVRLREVGIDSLAALHAEGVDRVVERVCARVGSGAWRNRRRALHRAVQAYLSTDSLRTAGVGSTSAERAT
jgi:hypothetical protein